jgi:hypothetical protein
MADFASLADQHKDLSVADQVKAGQATGTDMGAEHKKFLADLIGMIDRKELNASSPGTFLHEGEYNKLDEMGRSAVDVAVLNLADQLRHIENFYRSTKTPNASPELQTMIEYFWNMKSRLEEKYGDVLKF